ELTVEIVSGSSTGFTDTVEYEAATMRDGLVVLSWQEHIGSTIVHVLDLTSGQAYTAVTHAKVWFMRLKGRIEIKSGTCSREGLSIRPDESAKIGNGEMGEWLKPAVLKTVCGVTRTGVRIPLPPPFINVYFQWFT